MPIALVSAPAHLAGLSRGTRSRQLRAAVIAKRALAAAIVMGMTLSVPTSARPALPPLRTLHWTGEARIEAGGRVVDIAADTTVVPFTCARSATWLVSEGPASKRVLAISPAGGTLTRDGKTGPMPEPMVKHERQQYAIYGLMQLAMKRHARVIRSWGSDVPTVTFQYDSRGGLIGARDRVPDPETGQATIEQQFRFSGQIQSNGLKWPRQIEIYQAGKRYFTLKIHTFEAVPSLSSKINSQCDRSHAISSRKTARDALASWSGPRGMRRSF
jgi:hypothetical protein